MASANVFAGFLQPARSVFDYQQQLGQIDAGNVQTQAARQQLAAQADQLKREEADRNAFAALMQQYQDPQAATQAMLRSPSMTLYQKGMAAQKAQLDAQEAQAKIRETQAKTGKAEGETIDGALARYRSMLEQVQNPQMAAQWLQAQYSDPQVAPVMARMGTLEQAMAGIPQDPQGFEQWRQRSAMGMQKFMEAQRLGAAAQDTRANQTLVPDGKGGYMPNAPLIDAKARIAAAGASQNVTYGSPVAGMVNGQPVFFQPGNRGGPATVVTAPGGAAITPPPSKDQTKPLPSKVVTELKDARENAAAMDALATSFKPNFAGKGVMGLGADMQVGASANLGVDTDTVNWWKNYRKQAELVERHAMFGASLTQGEQSAWRSADIAPGMSPDVVKRNLATRQRLSKKVLESTIADMTDAGYDPQKVQSIGNRQGSASALAPDPAASGWKIERE